VVGAQVALIWVFPVVPVRDGPSHVYNADTLREYNDPAQPLIRQYYERNTSPEPNWATYVILWGLLFVTSPIVAEKLLLTGFTILLPASFRYALTGVNPRAGPLALAVTPFAHGFFYHMGFYNFLYGVAAYFIVVGWWHRGRGRMSGRDTAVLAGLLVATFFCHVLPFVFAYMTLAIVTASDAVVGLLSGRWRIDASVVWRRVAAPVLSAAPSLVLLAIFFRNHAAGPRHAPMRATWLTWLWQMDPFASYQAVEIWVYRLLLAAYLAVALLGVVFRGRERGTARGAGYGLAAVAAALIFIAGPKAMSGGAFISERMLFYAALLLGMWLAIRHAGSSHGRIIQTVACIATIALTAAHGWTYARYQGALREYLSCAPHIEPNHTLLTLCLDGYGHDENGQRLSNDLPPLAHTSGYMAAERNVIDLGNYEAGEYDYFPLRFRPALNPYQQMAAVKVWPDGIPDANFVDYTRETAGQVDYVLVFGMREEHRADDRTKSIVRQLGERYEQICRSQPRGLAELYRLR